MNVTQRLYDTRLKMITSDNNLHPLYFFRSIDLIRSRKTKYPKYDTFYLKKTTHIPYKTNYVVENNKKFSEKMEDIMKKKVTPKINNVFIELEERLLNNKKKNRDNRIRALTLENEKYNNRIMTQKAKILNAKYLRELYAKNHDKYLEILSRPTMLRNKKNKKEKSMKYRMRLPSITKYSNWYDNRLRLKTDKDEASKDNTLELNEHKRNEIAHKKPGNY